MLPDQQPVHRRQRGSRRCQRAGYDHAPGSPTCAAASATRDKKINLNYPLPVSNDPNEPIRQKWITDTYYTLKAILPPLAVDYAGRAGAAQPVRDQHRRLPRPRRDDDALAEPGRAAAVWNGTGPTSPVLIMVGHGPDEHGATDIPLDQYGMEYNPIAINEVLAYSFQRMRHRAPAQPTPRFFIELVNTLTSPELGTQPVRGWARR